MHKKSKILSFFSILLQSFDSLLEVVGKGQPVELSCVPLPPGKSRALTRRWGAFVCVPHWFWRDKKKPPRRFRSSQRTQQLPLSSFAGADHFLLPTEQLLKELPSPARPQPAAAVPVPEAKPASPAAGRSPKS